jgi:hypothetical protein
MLGSRIGLEIMKIHFLMCYRIWESWIK